MRLATVAFDSSTLTELTLPLLHTATIAAVESAYAIAAAKPAVSLSPQDLLSCMSAAFRWVRRNGIETWAHRPYTNNTGRCDGMYNLSKANCDCGEGGGDPPCPAKPKCPDACPADSRRPAVTVSGYTRLGGHGPIENTTMVQRLHQAPIVALVDCEAKAFKNYKVRDGLNPSTYLLATRTLVLSLVLICFRNQNT
jgi:hypothetical protein